MTIWIGGRSLALLISLSLLAACATPQATKAPSPTSPAAALPPALPWTASIGVFYNSAINQACTATLVQQDLILTAAHCLADGQPLMSLRRFVFLPNEGAAPRFAPLAVLRIEALGRQAVQGLVAARDLVGDWALLQIEPAPTSLRPVTVNDLRWAEIEERLSAGDKFFSGGYGMPGGLRLTQHDNCAPVDAAQYHFFLDDGLIASTCHVRPQDSGGPMILVDVVGHPHLIAIISGIGDPNGAHPLGIGVVSGGFARYLNGLPAT